MKAIILAGGKGSRFGKITSDTPKPLIKVANKYLIKHVLDNLPPAIDQIIIVLGYLGGKIKKIIGDNYRGCRVNYIDQVLTGTGGALLSVKYLIKKNEMFMVVGADDIFGNNELSKLICDFPAYGIFYGLPSSPSKTEIVFDDNKNFISLRKLKQIKKPRYFGVGAYVLPYEYFSVRPYLMPNGELSIPHNLPNMPFNIKIVEISEWLSVNNLKEKERAERCLAATAGY